MTELSGTLEGVGLPAIVRFLSGLKKTGCLRIVQDDWQGDIFFDAGQVSSASLGSRGGLSALDALVQALPSGKFTFDIAVSPASEPNISLSSEALQAHLDELAASSVNGSPKLPSLDLVPVLIDEDDSADGEEQLPLDRSTLQTLLAIDGQRTVREIIAQRGSLDALWQLASLSAVGLLRLEASASAPRRQAAKPASPPLTTPPVTSGVAPDVTPTVTATVTWPATESVSPLTTPTVTSGVTWPVTPTVTWQADPQPEPEPEPAASHACPLLGFEDDRTQSFGRPTRLHRCFAAGTPLPLSLDQQRELCISDQYGSCPRLAMAGLTGPQSDMPARPATVRATEPEPAARHSAVHPAAPEANGRSGALRPEPHFPPRSTTPRPESEADDPRIVRLPFAGRANAPDRASVADRQVVGAAEPTRFRAPATHVRDGAAARPTPLRTRMDRTSTSAASTGATPTAASSTAVAEPPVAPVGEPRKPEVKKPARPAAPADPTVEGGIRGVPVRLIGLLVLGMAVLAVGSYFAVPQLAGLFADDTLDPASSPNASAVAAGTPVTSIVLQRATPVANAAATSVPNSATSASASSASAAPAQPTLPPDPAQAAARPTPATQANAAQAPATGAQTSATGAQAGAPGAPTFQLDAAQPDATVQSDPAAQSGAAAGSIFDERFTTNARSWPSSPQGTAYLNGGTYRLAPRLAGQFVAVGAPIADVLQDVVVTASFRKLSGPAGGGYGIIVRDQGATPLDGNNQNGRYYVLEAGDKGEVGMWRRDADHWVDLLPWQRSDFVKPGNATNELTVRAVGNRLSLSVNGALIATRTDPTFASGNVGLFVGGDGNQVAVDHLSVQKP